MQKKRVFNLILVIMALLLSFSAVSAQDDGAQFSGIWPYQPPPSGHFNSYATGNLALGIYNDVMYPPMAIYLWASGEYQGLLADSFGFDDDNNFVVTLKSGITWSDGSALTAQDIVTTFNTFYLTNHQVWNSISKVEAVDDLTALFTVTAPSTSLQRFIITENLYSTSLYGSFADRAQALIDAGTKEGDDFSALLTELTEFRPETPVSSGPYVIDPASISDASITLNKNEGGFNSDVVAFDSVLVWNGETEVATPLIANGNAMYATHGFPPATEQSFIDAGIDILRGPGYSGPAIYVNYTLYPLNVPEVRQAMAMAIDRDENGFVSLGESGVGVSYMAGMSDALVDAWMSEDVIDGLNTYDYDPDAAAALLEGIGFTKGDDGVWVDDQGNPLAFELIFPAEFADWSAAAENAVQQLNDFGFNITGRAVQFEQQLQDVYDSNFQMAIRNWGTGSPFPGASYLVPYQQYNGQGLAAGEEVGGGMNFDVNLTYSGGELNAFDAATAAGQGLDVEAQREQVTALVQSYNELLPAVPLWERYGNNPLNRTLLEAPTADDPIYINVWSGTDAFVPYLILMGLASPTM